MRKAFTLIELLVVVVILALLLAILFPTFARMQERGREVRCASNLRQLHTAFITFISNNDGALPRSSSEERWIRQPDGTYTRSWHRGWVDSHPSAAGGSSYWWEPTDTSNGTFCIRNGTLFPYLGDRGDESVYVCPTMSRLAQDVFRNDPLGRSRVVRSYGMNLHVSYNDGIGGNVRWYSHYRDVDGVSRIVLFADQGFNNMGRTQFLRDTAPGPTDPAPTTQSRYLMRFHRRYDASIDYRVNLESQPEYIGEYHGRQPGRNTGMANVIFLDGHVERVAYTNTDWICRGDWEFGARVP